MLRADPSALPDSDGERGARERFRHTPFELAVLWREQPDMLNILAEFAEIPDKVKILQLSRLMFWPGLGRSDNLEKLKEEFQSILHSLPADLVSIFFRLVHLVPNPL